jgi:uncharacterized protein YjiS (DUF1127 family)
MIQQMISAIRRPGSRTRLDYAHVASMSDHMLRDIGVHRGDLRARVAGNDRMW